MNFIYDFTGQILYIKEWYSSIVLWYSSIDISFILFRMIEPIIKLGKIPSICYNHQYPQTINSGFFKNNLHYFI